MRLATRERYRQGGVIRAPSTPVIVAVTLGAVFVVTLGSAIAASVLIHLLGWWIGVPAAVAVIWFGGWCGRKPGVAYWLFRFLKLADGVLMSSPSRGAGLKETKGCWGFEVYNAKGHPLWDAPMRFRWPT